MTINELKKYVRNQKTLKFKKKTKFNYILNYKKGDKVNVFGINEDFIILDSEHRKFVLDIACIEDIFYITTEYIKNVNIL